MMTSQLLEYDLPREVVSDLRAKTGTTKTNFGELVEYFGLDPRRDFRRSDLRRVDFSNSDIRGFDFHGADLRGAIGSNVSWDETTLFEGADVSGSLFAHSVQQRAFFETDVAARRLFDRLKGESWMTTLQWVADNTKPTAKNPADAVKIANALFIDASEPFLKKNLLLFLSRGYQDRGSYLDFLVSTMSQFRQDRAIWRSVMGVMIDAFLGWQIVFDILIAETERTSGEHQRMVFRGIGMSPFERENRADVLELVRRVAEPLSRRAYVEGVARRMGDDVAFSMRDPWTKESFDLGHTIQEKALRYLAREWLRHSHRFTQSRSEDFDWSMRLTTERDAFQRILQIYREMEAGGIEVRVKPAETGSWMSRS